MAGGIDRFDKDVSRLQNLSFPYPERDALRPALLAQCGGAIGCRTQLANRGDVVRMNMRIRRQYKFEVKLPYQLQILIRSIQYGIDNQRFTPLPIGQQVGVG